MSVYTHIEPEQLQRLLADYAVGELEGYSGISAGITNTNYFVDTTLGHWVLTIFEQMDGSELPFYMDLMDHLAALGVPSAHPVTRRDGSFFTEFDGKPAALVHRLHGYSVADPSMAQCAAFGAVVAEMHRATETFAKNHGNSRGLPWARATREALVAHLDADSLALLDDELRFQTQFDYSGLPCGVVHADLFRDNVLFENGHVCGLIDFYYACNACWLFDLAIICNDWCHGRDGQFQAQRWQALASGYARRRPFTPAEHQAWPAMLRAAALRFWLSRLHDWHFPSDGHVTHHKDPSPFAALLRNHRDRPPPLTPWHDADKQ